MLHNYKTRTQCLYKYSVSLTRDALLALYVLWPCVGLSQTGILPKWLNLESWKPCRTIAQGL